MENVLLDQIFSLLGQTYLIRSKSEAKSKRRQSLSWRVFVSFYFYISYWLAARFNNFGVNFYWLFERASQNIMITTSKRLYSKTWIQKRLSTFNKSIWDRFRTLPIVLWLSHQFTFDIGLIIQKCGFSGVIHCFQC